jgi:hypothetical protein
MADRDEENLLDAEQWAEIEARLDADEAMTPHDEVVRLFLERLRS